VQNWQPSTLSWSFSRKTHFDSCRRHYFHDRFWGQDPKTRWKLFEMRHISTLAMLRGAVVHEVISRALRSIRLGLDVDLETAKQSVSEIIREKYMESQKRLWHIDNRPPDRKASNITNLLEHYYEFPDIGERAREARAVAWQSVENLMGSDIWREIAASDPKRWMEIDEDSFPHFDLDGIQVYTKIDFAHCNGNPTIIDWKTGAESEQDRLQLVLYSLYARAKWEWELELTDLAAVYLYPEFRADLFRPTQEDIRAVKDEAKHSFGEMLALEPAYGPADIEKFPKTDNENNCHWCRFRGMCGI
jgi:hypothetical protein